jgi:large subunit ribosomal protein L23
MAVSKHQKAKGPELESHQVVLRPLVTEKGTHVVERHNAYTFEVSLAADKSQIKKAVEELFEVKVVGVRTQIRAGKERRYKNRLGRTGDWKRAVVTLAEDDRIALF